jgi:phosphoribosylanthranilate isomerase
MRVKICGITNVEDALAAAAAGADMLGFIFYPLSPRNVSPEMAREIIKIVSREHGMAVRCVAVTVNALPEELVMLRDVCEFVFWQLHGDESRQYVEQWNNLGPGCVIKALRMNQKPVGDPGYPVNMYVADTPSASYGGTGKTFDWSHAVELKKCTATPVILSGGLTPQNVAEAIKVVQPYAVDVSSGVERAPGRKDHAKLNDFIQICKSLP